MKIVCDSCATKYSISDDKVRGKVFKIRCKKCSHIIVVRGTNDAAAAAPAPPAQPRAAAGTSSSTVSRSVRSPSPTSARASSAARSTPRRTSGRKGFADWLKLPTIPEFSDVSGSASRATMLSGRQRRRPVHRQPRRSARAANRRRSWSTRGWSPRRRRAPLPRARGGGLFSAIDAAQNAVVSSARVGRANAAQRRRRRRSRDAFGAPAARGGGGDLFASPAAAQTSSASRWPARRGAAGHDGGRVENLTAQRHENSVLFSLSNLQSLAMPAPAAKSAAPSVVDGTDQSEGSGLIDIRAMAATTLGRPADARRGGGSSGSATICRRSARSRRRRPCCCRCRRRAARPSGSTR